MTTTATGICFSQWEGRLVTIHDHMYAFYIKGRSSQALLLPLTHKKLTINSSTFTSSDGFFSREFFNKDR